MDKIILFDIDYTLIDTDIIKENILIYLCRAFGLDRVTTVQTRNEYIQCLDSSSDIDHDELIKYFSIKFGQKVKLPYKGFYQSSAVFGDTTYSDVRPALSKLSSGFRLGIYSEGFRKFQMAKLEMNGLIDYFDPELIFIRRRKLDAKVVTDLPNGSVIIDDKEEVVEFLSTINKLNPIWLNRQTKQKHKFLRTINSMLEVCDSLL